MDNTKHFMKCNLKSKRYVSKWALNPAYEGNIKDEKMKITNSILIATTEDLKEEKIKIIESIILSGSIPIDISILENPEIDKSTFIEQIIEKVNSVIVVIGGIYGIINQQLRKSYLELVYDYAKFYNKPIKILMRAPFDIIPPHQTDINLDNIKALREKIIKKDSVTYWKYIEDLEV